MAKSYSTVVVIVVAPCEFTVPESVQYLTDKLLVWKQALDAKVNCGTVLCRVHVVARSALMNHFEPISCCRLQYDRGAWRTGGSSDIKAD